MENKNTWLWYGVVAAIMIFLVVTNVRLSNLNKKMADVNDDLKIKTSILEFLYDHDAAFEQKVRHNFDVIMWYVQGQWVSRNNVNESKLVLQIQSAANACNLREVDELESMVFLGNERIIAQFNSSVGMLQVSIRNDSTITCQEHYSANQTACEDFCNQKSKNKISLAK